MLSYPLFKTHFPLTGKDSVWNLVLLSSLFSLLSLFCLSLQTVSDGDLVEGGAGWPVSLLPYRLYQRWVAYLTYKHDTFLLLSVLVTEQLTGLQLQSMGTGSSWLTVFSGLGVIGLASLCAIFIPSAHPSSKVQYVGLRSSLIFCVSCRVAPQPIT